MTRQLSSRILALCSFILLVLSASPGLASGDFFEDHLDEALQTGYSSSLDLDSRGEPHILYYDLGNDALYYTYRSGGSWSTELVSTDSGVYCSLVLDSNDVPHIAFHYVPAVGAPGLAYANRSTGSWVVEVIDTTIGRGTWCDITVDAGDDPHISYHDSRFGDLWYATSDLGVWITRRADIAGFCGLMSSIAIDPSGDPHIVHHDSVAGSLRHSWYDGTTWIREAAHTTTGTVGLYPDIEIDPQGKIYASHYSVPLVGEPELLLSKLDGAWTHEVVDTGPVDGVGTSIVLDASRNPHIAYSMGGASGELRYARHDGSSWILSDASTSSAGAAYPSLRRTGEGAVYIAFQSTSSEDLVLSAMEWLDSTPSDLDLSANSTGVSWTDVDNDGHLDIYLTQAGAANQLALGTGVGDFHEFLSPPLNRATDNFGVAWGDYDNDGDRDALVTDSGGPVQLVRNDGGGSYTDVAAGDLLGATGAISVDWVDYDGDDDLDLYLCRPASSNLLLRNDGGDVFTDVTPPELALNGSLNATWADFDGDGWMDVYVGVYGGSNVMLRNTGGAFLDVSTLVIEGPGSTRGAVAADYDNDGLLDIYQVNDQHGNALLRNEGGFVFADVTQAPLDDANFGYDADWGDIDNDGDMDLYLSNAIGENKLFRNDGGNSFADITHGGLALADGSHGMGFGDGDEDGDLDLFVADVSDQNAYLQNIAPNGNNWLQVILRGTLSNASAIGARVSLTTASGTQMRELHSSTASISQSSATLQFGLGADTAVDLLEVIWPNGNVQQFMPSQVNESYLIVEPFGEGETSFTGVGVGEGDGALSGLSFDRQLQIALSDPLGLVGEVVALSEGPSAEILYALLISDHDHKWGFSEHDYDLAIIDPTQGSVTEIIRLEFPYASYASHVDLWGLAWDPIEQRLYTSMTIYVGQTSEIALGRIDPVSGWVKNLVPLTASGSQIPSDGFAALAFTPSGQLIALSHYGSSAPVHVWEIRKSSMVATHLGATAQSYPGCEDAVFLGEELWILTDGHAGVTKRIGDFQGGAYAPATGGAVFLEGFHGLAARSCSGTQGYLTAQDVEQDAGDQIDLDWSSFYAPGGTTQFEIVRDITACGVLDPDRPAYDLVPAGTEFYRDTAATSYVSFYYAVRVIDAQGEVLAVLTAPPASAFPNVLINEFAPSGGVNPFVGGIDKRVGEFVEIFNNTGGPLDLDGWRLSNGAGPPTPDEEFLPPDIVPTGGYYSYLLTTIDLPDAGGELILIAPGATGTAVDIVSYGTAGGAPTVPTGFTVSRVEGTTSATPDDQAFEAGTATAGAPNTVPEPDLGNSLVINEVYYEGEYGGDFVELVNPLGSSLNLDRIVISDGVAFLDTLELGGQIIPGELLLFGPGGTPWLREITSEQLYLYKITSTGQLQRMDQLGWSGGPTPAQPEDALQRVPDGVATYLGDAGTNWVESGGGDNLLYGVPSPGLPNASPGKTVVVVGHDEGVDFYSINAALAETGPNTVIVVQPGYYDETFSLRDSTEIVGQIINGEGPVIELYEGGGPAVVADGVDASAKFGGFTIRGVYSEGGGSAMRITNAWPTIGQVVFESNISGSGGGAVRVDGGGPSFDGCSFLYNQADDNGGAVEVISGSPSFVRCLFVLNEAGGKGGALYQQNGSSSIASSIADRNATYAQYSGAIHSDGGAIDIRLSAVTFSTSGYALAVGGDSWIDFSCGSLHGNADGSYGDESISVQDEVFGDPLYCEPLGLGYALQDASPLANKSLTSCNEIIGITGPPCRPVITDTPPAQVLTNGLEPPYPNPFNPRTRLRFEIAHPGAVELALYDQRGRKVAELLRGRELPAGRHAVVWEGRDSRGSKVASGVYYARLKLDGLAIGKPQRLVLLK